MLVVSRFFPYTTEWRQGTQRCVVSMLIWKYLMADRIKLAFYPFSLEPQAQRSSCFLQKQASHPSYIKFQIFAISSYTSREFACKLKKNNNNLSIVCDESPLECTLSSQGFSMLVCRLYWNFNLRVHLFVLGKCLQHGKISFQMSYWLPSRTIDR